MNLEQLLAQLRAGASLSLDQLRFLDTELSTRAAAMPGQITAETAAEDAARIEREHQQALAEIERVRGLIAAAPPRPTPPSPDAQAAITAERARIAAIRRDGQTFNRAPEFIEQHINEGTSEQDFRLAILEEMRTAGDRNPTFSHASVTTDARETMARGMEAALVARMEQANARRQPGTAVQVPEVARPFMSRSLVELAAEWVDYRPRGGGRFLTGRDTEDVLARAFGHAARAGYLTVDDFPGIFTNALNNRLLARYGAAPVTYRMWAMPRQALRLDVAENMIRAGDFPALQLVKEAGEILSGSFSESKETATLHAYAIMLNITRRMMINDQLGAIEQVLGSAGERIADWENAQAYTLLQSASGDGPTLATDSVAVFNSAHGNLAGSGAAIGITSVGAAIAGLMAQTSLDGIKLNLTPSVLVCGPTDLTAAKQLLTSITPALISSAVPDDWTFAVVGDANISGNGWYMFADPGRAPAFTYSMLTGVMGPRLSSENVFDVQGMRVKLEHDFGIDAIDFRGAYHNPGA